MSIPGNRTDAEKQAWALYEMICASSADRPFAFHSIEQMHREIGDWKANNPALAELERASPAVLLAFLDHSFTWIKAESKEHSNFRVTSTLLEATAFALNAAPHPLPTEIITHLLADLQQDAWTRCYFPFQQLLTLLTRDQVTDGMRDELRKLHLQYAPSPTGKIEKRDLRIRSRLAELIAVEGEKQLDPGRGPWSQLVFEELAKVDDVTRAGWQGLLEHCRLLEQTVPGAKWQKHSAELIAALGEKRVTETFQKWLALGPTPGQPPGARSPIEDSAYQKGMVWCLASSHDPAMAVTVADFGIACLRKIPMLGAVSQKVGFACVQVLGVMPSSQAVAQLSRIRAKVKYTVAQRLIDKSLRQAAERSGMTVEDLEDSCVDGYGLDAQGRHEISIGDARAVTSLQPDGSVAVAWYDAGGKLVKSPPAHVKKAFAKEVKSVAAMAKELEQTYAAQRIRLESSLASPRTMTLAHWRKTFLEHPLLGFLGRRLIWNFQGSDGFQHSGLWSENNGAAETGSVLDSSGQAIDLSRAQTASLWHPLSSEPADLQRWRDRIFTESACQPFRQAFREFYQLTEDERETRMYSNRFAGILMRQHQLSNLCRARNWEYRLMGAHFDGFNVPRRSLPQWNLEVEFHVDLPSDRKPSLRDSALSEASGSGINLYVGSDQVRFYRDRREIALDEVPAVVYSEVMRDVDLFTSVCAVGEDETWSDQGDRGLGIPDAQSNLNQLAGILELRASVLTRVLPHTKIAERCRLHPASLEVRGQLGTYQIHLAWESVMLITDSGLRRLLIPRKLLDAIALDYSGIPFDLDPRTETILRKAHVLADDWKIEDPSLVRQFLPK
jgi:hypothetical protein